MLTHTIACVSQAARGLRAPARLEGLNEAHQCEGPMLHLPCQDALTVHQGHLFDLQHTQVWPTRVPEGLDALLH